MSDRFDEMAETWFAGLRHLESEQRARRSLAEFLRKTIEAELASERQGQVERDAALGREMRSVVDALRALSNGPSQLGDLADMLEAATPKLGAR
jgi:uncharacterized protein with von Willebrand factor type A (vWA) domain